MATTPSNARPVLRDPDHDRYHRQSLITWWDQERLRDATILVVGAGALGNELVKNLVLLGVGRIVVCDLDRIEGSNLARCVFFRDGDEGRAKAPLLAERAGELNADVTVEALHGDVRLRAGLGVFAAVDVVLGGLDNREARLYVNQACWKTSTPWIDGAIEGLMGVARVFVPPASACYECTMSAHDREIVAARRSCALLSQEDVREGKVPTTATSASVIAGIQAQEAVKLLHAERVGAPELAGAGFQFFGLTHESYVVRYTRDEECRGHDTYALETAREVSLDTTIGELLRDARETLGATAELELEHDLVLSGTCEQCDLHEELMQPTFALGTGTGLCPGCGEPRVLDYAYRFDEQSPLLERPLRDLRLPTADVIVARTEDARAFYRLGEGDPLALALGSGLEGAT